VDKIAYSYKQKKMKNIIFHQEKKEKICKENKR
jgi:hypothetical protein